MISLFSESLALLKRLARNDLSQAGRPLRFEANFAFYRENALSLDKSLPKKVVQREFYSRLDSLAV